MSAERSELILERGRLREVFYRIEQSRGYEAHGSVWSPGYFRTDLKIAPATRRRWWPAPTSWDTMLVIGPQDAYRAECERRQRLLDQAPEAARQGLGGEWVLAADQFIIRPATRGADAALRLMRQATSCARLSPDTIGLPIGAATR